MPPRPINELPPEVLQKWEEMNAEHSKLEEKGIYINLPNTGSFKGRSIMPVGNTLMFDDNEHATFHELVLKNLQHTLGKQWWDTESAKSPDQQHFIRKCFNEISSKQFTPEQDVHQETEHVRSFLPTGHLQSLMSLAFDVYVLTHKNSLPKSWLNRLRKRDQYQGVRYEIAVASIFVRVGCELEFISDNKTTGKHPEFIATHKESGNRVAVEAKSRHRPGVIHFDGELDLKKAMLGDVESLFEGALQKETNGLPYIIFIDVNAPIDINVKTVETQWFSDIKEMMDNRGGNTPKNPEKYNALFVTNYSPHYEGDKVTPTGQYVIVANPYTQHPLSDGVNGNFTYRLMQAANGYGFVPKL